MRDSRRTLLLLVTATLLPAQRRPRDSSPLDDDPNPENIRLPNGKRQMDEILKADYEKNLSDARELTGLAKSFEQDLEKNEAFVFSLASLKKLDDMEKLTKRIRARLKRA
ncbi:MAG: hypothetical protein ABSG41_04360 [Bryobacteraceae bacterium]|jgi:hypothetical protein